jgi:cytochrome P450
LNLPSTALDKCPHITFADPDILACPLEAYKTLQDEAPVYHDPGTGMYVVTRYADIRAIAADPQTFVNNTGQLQGRQTPATARIDAMLEEAGVTEVNTLVTNDPPDHRRYRSIVDKAFRINRVIAMKPRISEIANELIDSLPREPFDFVQAFAIWLPMRMIAEQLGVPPEMGDTFKRWSDATIESTDPRIDPDRHVECTKLKIEMNLFLAVRGDALRATPDDTLISDIANSTVDGRPLTRGEFCSLVVQLLVGGNETTTSALASGVYHLASNPDLQAELRAAPAKLKAFCEEVLRLESPLQGLFRRSIAPTTLGGVEIPEGAILNIRWAAGNRDPRMFPEPEMIMLDRPNSTQHLTFGHGIHYCIGNQLARAELHHGFEALLARSRNIGLTGEEGGIERLVHFMAHGPRKLVISFERP